MFSSLTFCLFIGVALGADDVLFCNNPPKSDGTSCSGLTVDNCESIEICELYGSDDGVKCRCKESLDFLDRSKCKVFGFDCLDYNKPRVGSTAQDCPTDVCKLEKLEGKAKDEFENFDHEVEHHGCVAYETESTETARMGVCNPSYNYLVGLFVQNDCDAGNPSYGVTAQGGADTSYTGNESAACNEGEICCLPKRVSMTGWSPAYYRNFMVDNDIFVVSPSVMDPKFGENYFLGETVDLKLKFGALFQGKTVDLHLVTDLGSKDNVAIDSKPHVSKRVQLPQEGSEYSGKLDLMADTIVSGATYHIVVHKVDEIGKFRMHVSEFTIVSPPCFASVRNEFQDQKDGGFGGLCVQSEAHCSAENFGEKRKWFPGKHCKNVEGFENFGCCVPNSGSTDVMFREQEGNGLTAAATTTSATVALLGALFGASAL